MPNADVPGCPSLSRVRVRSPTGAVSDIRTVRLMQRAAAMRHLQHRIDARASRGFTLIETIVALALMGLVLSALASITAQWLPELEPRHRPYPAQRVDRHRAAADRGRSRRGGICARPTATRGSRCSMDRSCRSRLVRTALGPNAGPGLDVVRIGETTERTRVRDGAFARAFRAACRDGSSLSEQLHFGDPVVLLRAPFRLSFAYAGSDRVWKGSWHEADRLPAMIRLTVRDAASRARARRCRR